MKIIFFGAGYCTNFIIPLLPRNTKIICTHNHEVKPQHFDKNFDIQRVNIKNFLERKEYFLNDTNFILNSVPPKNDGDVILKNLSQTIIKFKKQIKWYGYP